MVTLIGISIFLFLLLLSTITSAQNCSNTPDSVILNPNRKIDSAFQPSIDKWSFVSYEIQQSVYSEVHLKYFNKNVWNELDVNHKEGIFILKGCIPPNSWVIIECLSLGKPPKIIKQIEKIYQCN